MSIQWTKREGGIQADVPNLGLVEIFKGIESNSGYTVLINQKIAWSEYRGSLDQVKRYVADDLRKWSYINSFTRY